MEMLTLIGWSLTTNALSWCKCLIFRHVNNAQLIQIGLPNQASETPCVSDRLSADSNYMYMWKETLFDSLSGVHQKEVKSLFKKAHLSFLVLGSHVPLLVRHYH